MKNILVVPGSNSTSSINRELALHAAAQIENSQTSILDLSRVVLPLYGPDLEAESGIPAEVHELDSLIESADGLIVSLAEYNGSYAAAFKNAFDWLSRIDMKVWKNKPMLLMATSPGGGGGAHVLASARNDFPHFGGNIAADFSLPLFHENFGDRKILSEELRSDFLGKVELFRQALN